MTASCRKLSSNDQHICSNFLFVSYYSLNLSRSLYAISERISSLHCLVVSLFEAGFIAIKSRDVKLKSTFQNLNVMYINENETN